MNFAVQTIFLVALLSVCCFTPGFFFVRRLRWTPLEKLSGSIALSIILLYIDAFIVFLVGRPGSGIRVSATPFVVSSIVCVVLGIAAFKDLLRIARSFRVKRALAGYGFLLLWTIVILGAIRVYSGAHWSGDWQEHFHRTLFFFQRLPTNTVFGDVYSLPARPPLMNVVASYFLAQTQDRFEFFQIIYTFLNLLIFLPCCLLLPIVTGQRRARIMPLLVVFALNPVVMENTTYSWSRGLTAFFVLVGVALYLSAWRKDDEFRMVAAFVSLAAGLLVHYSAGPYVVFIGTHYVLWLFWRRRQKWKELATITTACVLLLGSWFGWASLVYRKDAFLSNTTVTATQEYEGSNVAKVAGNFFDSIIPPFVRNPAEMDQFRQQRNSMGRFRDYIFLLYQSNVIFNMGMIGGPAVLWLLFRRFRRRSWNERDQRTFWLAFAVSAIVLGSAVVGTREPLGLAHGTFLSLELVGLGLLAGTISHRGPLRTVLLLGCIVDFSLGILLHAHVQSFENGRGKNYFSELEYKGSIRHADPGPDSLSEVAWQNWFEKHQRALCDRWLQELPQRNKNESFFKLIWPASQSELLTLRSQDDVRWGGWYSRHNGEITYWGDHVAGVFGDWVPASVLLALFAGLIVVFLKQPTVAALHFKEPPQTRSKGKAGAKKRSKRR